MYHVSAQGVDERMINVHYYNFIYIFFFPSGLFDASHMDYEYLRTPLPDALTEEAGEPSLAEMTAAAIRILSRGNNGFFLFVEGTSQWRLVIKTSRSVTSYFMPKLKVRNSYIMLCRNHLSPPEMKRHIHLLIT